MFDINNKKYKQLEKQQPIQSHTIKILLTVYITYIHSKQQQRQLREVYGLDKHNKQLETQNIPLKIYQITLHHMTI